MKREAHSRRSVIITVFALFAAVWLLSANSIPNGFAVDDKDVIGQNRFLFTGTPLSTVFSTSYRAGAGGFGDGLYRPLVILSFMLNGTPENPRPFHLFNVTLNAAAVALFFLLLMAICGNLMLSAVAAALFGFHPVHTEAVANIAGRPELLCAFFLLAAWLLLEKYREKAWSPGAAAILFLASLCSKETAVMFPVMVLANDLAHRRPILTRNVLHRYLPLAAALAVYFLLRANALFGAPDIFIPKIDNPVAHAPIVERLATAFTVCGRYLLLLAFPLRLSWDYSYNAIPAVSSFLNPGTLAGIALFCGIIAAGMAAYRRGNSLGALASALFLLPYLPVSNLLFPIGTIMGERLMYLPSAGFALGIALLLTPLLTRRNRWVIAALALVLLLFAARTVIRNRDWRDDRTLLAADVNTVPDSAKTLTTLGTLTDGETAMGYLRRALEIMPDNPDALRGYGRRLYEAGRYDESARCFARAAEVAPDNVRARADYGILLRKLGRFTEAERELHAAIRLNPTVPTPYQELSTVLIGLKRYPEALVAVRKAAELGGDPQVVIRNLVSLQFISGDAAAAYRGLEVARRRGVSLDPALVNAILAANGMEAPPVRE